MTDQRFLAVHPLPFLWLIELQGPAGAPLVIPDDPEGDGILRLTPNLEPVTFGTSTDGTPLVWDPFPIAHDGLVMGLGDEVAPLTITASGALGEVFRLAEANDWFRSCRLLMHIVHAAELASFAHRATEVFRVAQSQISLGDVSLELAAGNWTDFDVPQELAQPECRWTYRSEGCYFAGDPGDAELGMCALTREACNLRGIWELANGIPVIHPRQWGGVELATGEVRA